jgi:hypothetical protein
VVPSFEKQDLETLTDEWQVAWEFDTEGFVHSRKHAPRLQ